MFNQLICESVWKLPNNLSKTSLFVGFLVGFCSIILFRKLFRRKSFVNPEGKAVLITGCDSGFGHQLALRLNSLGYRVYATVLDIKSAENLTKESQNKDQMIVWKMNVTLDDDIKEVYSKVTQDLETNDCKLWSVVNNAGYAILAQINWMDLHHHKNMFEVNVFGTVRVTKVFIPLLRESKGRIVFMSSTLGIEVINGYGGYCMTKHAITAFSRTLRREMKRFGVKVVTLFPGGYLDTNFAESALSSAQSLWDQMDDSLKDSFGGQQYFDLFKRNQMFSHHFMTKKSYQVVNALVEGITNTDPNDEYSPIGWTIGNIMEFMLRNLPVSIRPALNYLDTY